MLFAFRGMRLLQAVMAIGALACGVGAVVSLKVYTDGGSVWSLLFAIFLGLVFLFLFGSALRAPTSFVAVAPDRTRIRYVGFLDRVFENAEIESVALRNWPLWGGLGVRTAFRGEVALVSMWGTCAEVRFRSPVRVWLIPRLIPVRGRRLILSVKNPEKLVERFAGSAIPGSPASSRASKVRKRGSRTR